MENIPARHAVEITDLPPEELERYGILYNLSGRGRDTGNVVSSSGDGWEATDIRGPLIRYAGVYAGVRDALRLPGGGAAPAHGGGADPD